MTKQARQKPVTLDPVHPGSGVFFARLMKNLHFRRSLILPRVKHGAGLLRHTAPVRLTHSVPPVAGDVFDQPGEMTSSLNCWEMT
jgi:hypothetical protein